jgi:tetratricopeptide (TPR) repeat protein
MAQLDALRGRIGSAARRWERAFQITAGRDLGEQYLERAARRAITERLLLDDPERGCRILDEALARYPLEQLVPLDRPYGRLALAYAAADEPARARALVAEYDRTPEADHSHQPELWRGGATGVIALAEGRLDDALAALGRFDEGNSCGTCAAAWLARAYDRAGRPDSARAVYQRLAETPSDDISYDAGHLGYGYLRLGALPEEAGDRARAVEYHERFIALWREADPRLQPWVEQARRAVDRLSREAGRT